MVKAGSLLRLDTGPQSSLPIYPRSRVIGDRGEKGRRFRTVVDSWEGGSHGYALAGSQEAGCHMGTRGQRQKLKAWVSK